MRYRIMSTGAWGDLADTREDVTDRLGFALAIFGAESTLRCVARDGTVTLYDRHGRELLAYNGERLSVLGGPFFGR